MKHTDPYSLYHKKVPKVTPIHSWQQLDLILGWLWATADCCIHRNYDKMNVLDWLGIGDRYLYSGDYENWEMIQMIRIRWKFYWWWSFLECWQLLLLLPPLSFRKQQLGNDKIIANIIVEWYYRQSSMATTPLPSSSFSSCSSTSN